MAPIEKVYLHFDRDNYIAGETAWFKAYLYSEYLPDTISTSLYTELLRPGGEIIARNVLPVLAGTTHGQFELPDTLTTGYYLLRAYTAPMLNRDSDFIYQRSLFIYGRKEKDHGMAPPEQKISLSFFPEGGNFVQGLPSILAFKATDAYGWPVPVSGMIKNGNNETMASFSSVHDGMGLVEILPAAGQTYFAVIDGDAGHTKYPLPDMAAKGIALSLIPHPQGHFFEIRQAGNDPFFNAAYMIGQMQHHVVFRQQLQGSATGMQGVINTQHLPSGILQVTVFNKDGSPLAERLCFVDNKEYRQSVQLLADTISFSPRGRNHFLVQLKDTVQGSISVSVTDPAFDLAPSREENIYSGLLLTADIRGYVHHPAYYFSSDEDSVKNALDLLLMTQGWRRFRWTELLKNKIPAPRYEDGAYITLTGKASLRSSRKPFASRQLLLLIGGADNKRITQVLSTDKDGGFRIDSLLFFGNARLLFTDIRGKKSQYIDVILTGDTLTRSFPLPAADISRLIKYFPPGGPAATGLAYDYDAIRKANGTMLENINIRVQKKTPLQQVDDRYTNGPFSGDATRSIDLVNNEDAMPYENIFDYLQARVNGLQVFKDGLDYTIFYRQGTSLSAMGNVPMALFLDEVPTDASVISAIPANQVALVKVFNTFSGATGNGQGGVLAIYTKKGSDYVRHRGMASTGIYNGYSVIKEFYAPVYPLKKDEPDKPDHRITLDWRPDILLNYVDPSVPVSFFNNDRSKKFRVVVEGMTNSGKLIWLEKIITPR